jgi:hypothetical protein
VLGEHANHHSKSALTDKQASGWHDDAAGSQRAMMVESTAASSSSHPERFCLLVAGHSPGCNIIQLQYM